MSSIGRVRDAYLSQAWALPTISQATWRILDVTATSQALCCSAASQHLPSSDSQSRSNGHNALSLSVNNDERRPSLLTLRFHSLHLRMKLTSSNLAMRSSAVKNCKWASERRKLKFSGPSKDNRWIIAKLLHQATLNKMQNFHGLESSVIVNWYSSPPSVTHSAFRKINLSFNANKV